MKNHRYCHIFCLIALYFLFIPISHAASGPSRTEIINTALDSIEKSLNQPSVGWNEVSDMGSLKKKSSTLSTEPLHKTFNDFNRKAKKDFEPSPARKISLNMDRRGGRHISLKMDRNPAQDIPISMERNQGEMDDLGGQDTGRKNKELALQISSYHYEADGVTPTNYALFFSQPNEVEKKARLFGFHGSYTWHTHPQNSPRKGKDFMKNSPLPDFIRFEGNFSWGKLKYDSFATGEMNNFDAWKIDARALLGLDFSNQDNSLTISPYTGFGYRRFTDEAGGWVDNFVVDYARYPVKHSYYYIPIGIEAYKTINHNWDAVLKLEGDAIIAGGITYHLSEIPGQFDWEDFNTGLPIVVSPINATSDIKSGYGIKTSFKLIKKLNEINFFTEPFFEFWRVNKTKAEQLHASATNGNEYVSVNENDGSPYKPLFEPLNYTLEYGVRLGVQF